MEAAGANASRRPGPGSARIPRRDIVNTFSSHDVEAADEFALARLDDDGAPPAVTLATDQRQRPPAPDR